SRRAGCSTRRCVGFSTPFAGSIPSFSPCCLSRRLGSGPSPVLGIGLHSAGTIAKLWSEAIEAVEPGPLEAAALTGANRLKVISYALLPDILPNLTSITLYVWEFNVRSSTVLGVVGAGGIGQELKNSVDLLDFARLFTIILIILAMVTAIDQFSAWLRRR